MALAHDLRTGLPGSAGSIIRWRRESDPPSVLSTLHARAVGLELPHDHFFLHPAAGSAAPIGVANGPSGILQRFAGKSLDDIYTAYCTILVAQVDGQIVGATFTAPPPQVFDMPDPTQAARAIMQVAKLAALSVCEEYANRGIATSLLATMRSIYALCRVAIMYGEFSRDRTQLASFYRTRGFDLLNPNDAIDRSPLLQTGYYIQATPTEQLFVGRLLTDYPYPLILRHRLDASGPVAQTRSLPAPTPLTPPPAPEGPRASPPRRISWWKRSQPPPHRSSRGLSASARRATEAADQADIDKAAAPAPPRRGRRAERATPPRAGPAATPRWVTPLPQWSNRAETPRRRPSGLRKQCQCQRSPTPGGVDTQTLVPPRLRDHSTPPQYCRNAVTDQLQEHRPHLRSGP